MFRQARAEGSICWTADFNCDCQTEMLVSLITGFHFHFALHISDSHSVFLSLHMLLPLGDGLQVNIWWYFQEKEINDSTCDSIDLIWYSEKTKLAVTKNLCSDHECILCWLHGCLYTLDWSMIIVHSWKCCLIRDIQLLAWLSDFLKKKYNFDLPSIRLPILPSFPLSLPPHLPFEHQPIRKKYFDWSQVHTEEIIKDTVIS